MNNTTWKQRAMPGLGLLAAFLLVLLALPALALTWSTETVDSGSVGRFPSLALDPTSNLPRISYYDAGNTALKYASFNGATWDIETPDNSQAQGEYTSLALDPTTGYPRISYYDASNDALEYASFNGATWDIETVDSSANVGQWTSLALDPTTGNPRISYYDVDNTALKYASFNGATWDIETVDNSADVGEYTSLALDPTSGNPRISYYDATNTALKYASFNGVTWDIETVDGSVANDDVGKHTSLALDPTSGHPRISYYANSGTSLEYASFNGATWDIETPDNAANVGQDTSLALDPATGNPRISYRDLTNTALKYAAFNGATWDVEEADNSAAVGQFTSLALDPCGNPRIAHFSSSVQGVLYTADDGDCARLTIAKTTDPAGGTDFPFLIDPTAYNFDFRWGANGGDGSSGAGNGEFSTPSGVALDADGNVYVADAGNNRIQKFDSSGGYLAQWGSSGSGNGDLTFPNGVAVDAAGDIYVVDTGNSRVQKFDSSGGYLAQWGSSGSGNGEFAAPRGVAVDAAGNVYVADAGNNRIQKFDSSGGYLAQWGSSGSGNGELIFPIGVAVDAAGNVYVADYGNNRVQKFDSSGGYLAQWGNSGSGNGQFNQPTGVAVDAAGNVYVADAGNNRIQKLDSSGDYLAQWGSSGSGSGEFNTPSGLAVDPAGHVYVGDSVNNRIQVFTPDLSTTLDDGQSESFFLAPGSYTVSELVPAGWMVNSIDCGDGIVTGQSYIDVTLADGDDVTCTFDNLLVNVCPVDAPDVGTDLTTLLGRGMGSPTRQKLVGKIVVPNTGDLTDLYGQMAAKEFTAVKFVRFIYPDKSYIQVDPETDLGEKAAISWWGADLDQNELLNKPYIKGRFFLNKGMRKMKTPRAFVVYATYDTGGVEVANTWSTFTSISNFVAGTPGFDQSNTNLLPIPETQGETDLVVQLAVTDVNRDARTVDVIVRAGGVEVTTTLTGPTTKKSELLNLFEVTLEDVPAGVDEVEIELVSILDEGDSAALLGAAASYVCEPSNP